MKTFKEYLSESAELNEGPIWDWIKSAGAAIRDTTAAVGAGLGHVAGAPIGGLISGISQGRHGYDYGHYGSGYGYRNLKNKKKKSGGSTRPAPIGTTAAPRPTGTTRAPIGTTAAPAPKSGVTIFTKDKTAKQRRDLARGITRRQRIGGKEIEAGNKKIQASREKIGTKYAQVSKSNKKNPRGVRAGTTQKELKAVNTARGLQLGKEVMQNSIAKDPQLANKLAAQRMRIASARAKQGKLMGFNEQDSAKNLLMGIRNLIDY